MKTKREKGGRSSKRRPDAAPTEAAARPHDGNGSVRSISRIEDLLPDEMNANRGTERGLGMLAHSLEQYGAGRSGLVDRNGKIIAGNKTVQAAAEKGLAVRVVRTDGTELVIVQRTDLDMDADPRARALAVADNRVAEIDLAWDGEQLADLQSRGVDLGQFFMADELERVIAGRPYGNAAADGTGPGPGDGVFTFAVTLSSAQHGRLMRAIDKLRKQADCDVAGAIDQMARGVLGKRA